MPSLRQRSFHPPSLPHSPLPAETGFAGDRGWADDPFRLYTVSRPETYEGQGEVFYSADGKNYQLTLGYPDTRRFFDSLRPVQSKLALHRSFLFIKCQGLFQMAFQPL